ncbi:MAG TPA: thiamine pyrophosphate-dependent dehydrogenase E1 component subunit alpha [Pseudogracilibacillus sp.]|nr:thiamine pyrophosphate-dependent dehydrogenase E1 component subunit alpha [Pseudogracilibacillus sp.]
MSKEVEFYTFIEDKWDWDDVTVERIWYKLNQIRAFEETSVHYYQEGAMGGSLHTSIGQEAIAVGVCRHLNNDDYMTMTYRGRGQALAKGADPYKIYAEMFGKADGYCKGKGGPMHIASKELGILGANGIVGAGIPIAVGGALTAKTKGTDQVAVTFFGDGATNQGVFHESLNLAAVLTLPVIFVIENNMYSEMTRIEDSVMIEHLAERGASYGMPAIVVDGNDVRAVSEVAKEAIERARNGEGPTLIEAKTYRLHGHMFGDEQSYRSKEEIEAKWEEEPIKRFKENCLDKGIVTEERLKEIKEEVYSEIEASAKKAIEAEEPALGEVFTDVY